VGFEDILHPSLDRFYKELHSHPELSLMEEKTSAKLAAELRATGFTVTERFGGFGIVGVLPNGPGPTVLVRTDMDALPVEERTGLPYASTVKTKDLSGQTVGVMHACGHDVHMTVFVGTARLLSKQKDRWSGTLVMIGQPAEEMGVGARAMLREGLFRRFPKPDYAVALHDSVSLPAGTIGLVEGYQMANVDTVTIKVYGVGGHGAYPHLAKDPIVLAARIILSLQMIVSRETNPIHPAVVTVGSIHGGTRPNIIPDVVELQLTLRSYADDVRAHTIEAIRRICRGEAIAAGFPDDLLPEVNVLEDQYTPAAYNDPALTRRVRQALTARFGAERVKTIDPEMGGEDFSEYGHTVERVPLCMFRIGAVAPEKWTESMRTGVALPALHSSRFAPLPEPTIETGVAAMATVVLDLLGRNAGRDEAVRTRPEFGEPNANRQISPLNDRVQ
jgi:hippurate hydrolase